MMLISQEIMDKMHDIQYDMLKELIGVINQLGLKYYFVHGSLLGAIRDNDFIAEDDDIDIALFRDDYNYLMLHGQALLSESLVLQNSVIDSFPLSFAKLRKDDTAFIQPILSNVDCHKGIYIDIFPIDYECKKLSFVFTRFILEGRISQIFPSTYRNKKKRLFDLPIKILEHSYYKALMKREILYSSVKRNKYVVVYGGKSTEAHMPSEWFEEQSEFMFRDIMVSCPSNYDAYLKRIYGENYMNHNPAEQRINNKDVEISADVLDFEKSYLEWTN